MSWVLYRDHPDPLRTGDTFLGIVKGAVREKQDLLHAVASALLFPDYFGFNWDALYECLRDLTWIPKRRVVLYHRDLPLAEHPDELRTYLDILRDASADRGPMTAPRFCVVFHSSCESIVEGMESR